MSVMIVLFLSFNIFILKLFMLILFGFLMNDLIYAADISEIKYEQKYNYFFQQQKAKINSQMNYTLKLKNKNSQYI